MNLKLEMMKLAARINRKKDVWKDTTGEAFLVPREGNQSVKTFLYRPASAQKPWPVLFNLHGGAWVGSDASQMDSYCTDMANACGCFIVNINYTKLDVHPFPYPQEEICDTILYFRNHAEEYGLDTDRFAVIGYSAGGHLAASVALMLHDRDVDLSAQVLCYPFLNFSLLDELGKDEKERKLFHDFFFGKNGKTDDPYLSPYLASDAQLKGLAPAIFVTCGEDPLTAVAEAYHKRLLENGVPSVYRYYEKSLHGFLEGNRKEYRDNPNKTPEQTALAREAEKFITSELRRIWKA